MSMFIRVSCALALVIAGGCGKGASVVAAAAEQASSASPSEAALVERGTAPEGLALAPRTVAGVALSVPSGGDWQSHAMGLGIELSSESTGLTVMIQKQPGVPAEARDAYVASFISANQRDAPRYAVGAKALGTVSGHSAARVDGAFNNGTAFKTRDYVVFANGAAVAIMVRGAEADSAKVQALADAIAASIGS